MKNIQDQEWKNELQSEISEIHRKIKSLTIKLEISENKLEDLNHGIGTVINEIEELKKTLDKNND